MLGGGWWRAQQPAAETRDNSLDVRVWWPTAAKKQLLNAKSWAQLKAPPPHTYYTVRGEAVNMYSFSHLAPALLCTVPELLARTLSFSAGALVNSSIYQATGPFPSPWRWNGLLPPQPLWCTQSNKKVFSCDGICLFGPNMLLRAIRHH